jgi:hypothetical protein
VSTQDGNTSSFWLKLAALVLVIAALGLPINDLYRYFLLLAATVPIFVGAASRNARLWLAAIAIVALTVLVRALFPAPQIDEGHNVFIVDGRGSALEQGLPSEAYRLMAAEFDAAYPVERRCDPATFGCWRGQGFPDRAYAFSADAIYQRTPFSRRVTGIDFNDPVWLRLGFINELQYNWTGSSDLLRGARERSVVKLLHPWRLTTPFFVMYRFPAEFIGSRLCWQGQVLWEGANEQFVRWQHREPSCRPIEPDDVGRRIFGVAIATPLSMSLDPGSYIRLRGLLAPALALFGVATVLMLLVRWRDRQLTLPFVLIGLALLVIVLNDASFIGGVRPFDGGDDGLAYEGLGRRITQHLLAGDIAAALEGGEKVYYYGGPGLRYFRSLEHFVFGDSFFGYLSLVLTLPFLVLTAFRRFIEPRTALALTLVFVAIPIGALFGTSFFHYPKWAARGFADPAAAIAFLASLVVLIGRPVIGPDTRFASAFGAGLLFALALWLRPNLAPGAAVLLGGAGLAALWHGEFRRLAGLCIGFAPVLGMPLHNWVFGNAVVLFSSNADASVILPTPPSIYTAAVGDLVRLDFTAGNLARVLRQWTGWLSGPSESIFMVPLDAIAVAILLRVGFQRRYEFWIALTAWATMALHAVALFYSPTDRYHYLAWLLTLLVCAIWVRDEGIELLKRWSPSAMARIEDHERRSGLLRLLDRLTAP